MANDLRSLLTYIVEHRLADQDRREAELDATAVQDVAAEVQAVARDQREDAARLAPFFEEGLRRARSGALTVSDTDQEGSGIAEAFARFLVAPNLATSQSAPLREGGFTYTFEVNWPRLQSIAREARVDLDAALKGQA